MRQLIIYRDKHPIIGPVFWLLSLQYYMTQYVVAHAWSHSFSLRHNLISDLGNTACGPYYGRYVCSPAHNLMNASFIVLGLTMMIGSVFIHSEFRQKPWARVGFFGIALAGFGTALVGLFPENTVAALHFSGALLPFLIGNLALIVFSRSLSLPSIFKWYTGLSGIVALGALVLFELKQYLFLQAGGMERVVAYPQTIWLIAFGVYLSMNHYRQRNGRYTS